MRLPIVLALLAAGFVPGVLVGYLVRPDAARAHEPRAESSRTDDIAVRSSSSDSPDATKPVREPGKTRTQGTDGDVASATKPDGTADADAEEPSGSAPVAKRADRRLEFDTGGKAIRAMEWDEVGGAMSAIGPVVVDIVRTVNDGKDVTPQQMGALFKHMAPLVEQGMKLQGAGVPGTNDNAQWTHPSILANLIHATLRQAGQPLTEKQEDDLHSLGLRYIEDDKRQRAAYTDGMLTVDKMIGEVTLRDAFLGEVVAMLNTAQRNVLRPKETTGRVGLDLFGGNNVWHERIDFVEFTNRQHLEEQIVTGHAALLKLTDESMPVLRAAVQTWSAGMSDEFLAAEADPLTAEGHPTAGRAMRCARLQTALHKTLLQQASLTKKQRDALAKHDRVAIPFRSG